jgi:hypothetical protein
MSVHPPVTADKLLDFLQITEFYANMPQDIICILYGYLQLLLSTFFSGEYQARYASKYAYDSRPT